MSTGLEIRDGSPRWYLSQDILTVPGDDPDLANVGFPLVGQPCFVYARVRNHSTTRVQNARVNFYWANPAIGFNRATAHPIGSSFVSLEAGAEDWVLCLTGWNVEFVGNGHVCLLVEVFTPGTSAPDGDFRVPTDDRVAQLNLTLVPAVRRMNYTWIVPVELHNVTAREQAFDVEISQGNLKDLLPLMEARRSFDFDPSADGHLEALAFVDSSCPTDDQLKRGNTTARLALPPGGRAQMLVAGRTPEGLTLVDVVQRFPDGDRQRAGGVSILADARNQ